MSSDPFPLLRFASNFRALRKGLGIPQRELGILIGIPRATIAHLESHRANPTLKTITQIERWLSVSYDDLMSVPGTQRHRAFIAHVYSTKPRTIRRLQNLGGHK